MEDTTILSDQKQYTGSKGIQLIAYAFSIVLHPIFMTLYGVMLLFVYTDFQYIFFSQFSKFFIPTFIFSFIIPTSSTYLFGKIGYITNFDLTKQKDRFLPMLVPFMSYSMLIYYFHRAGLYSWFLALLAVPVVLLVLCGIITLYRRISIYMVGIGGLIGSVFSVCYNIKGQNPYLLFVILIIFAGILGSCRLLLNKSTPLQVLSGFMLGLVISYLVVFIGAYYPIFLILY